MLRRWRRLVFVPAFMIVAAPLAMLPTSAPREVQAQEVDPVQVVEDFFDAVDSGDVDGAVALLADDFQFTSIDERNGSFMTVGKPAFESVLNDVVDLNNQTTLSDLANDGNTVTGVAAFSDDDSEAAGVDRYLQPFSITLNDEGLATRADFTYDEDDAQTDTYLEYTASQDDGDDGPPPGAVNVTMNAQSGSNQTGEAFMFDQDGITAVGVFVESGPEGVLQPAHLHTGTCEAPGPIVQPLASVLNGGAFTLLSPYPMTLANQGLIINVHKSEAESGAYVSCGVVQPIFVDPTPTTVAPAATPTAGSGVVAPDTGNGPPSDGPSAWLYTAAMALAGIGLVGTALRLRAR